MRARLRTRLGPQAAHVSRMPSTAMMRTHPRNILVVKVKRKIHSVPQRRLARDKWLTI